MHYEILQTNNRFIKMMHKVSAMAFMAVVVVGLTATIVSFAGQDMFNNMSVVHRFSNGSNDSHLGYLLLAIGLAWGSVFMGAALAYRRSQNKSAWIYGLGIVAMSVMSGAFTMTATSSDAAGNAQESKLNQSKLDALLETQSQLNSKMNECKRDRYYKACQGIDQKLSENAQAISNVDTTKVDIIAATPNGELWHSVIVYGRSFVSPALCGIMMTLLMSIILGRKTIKQDAVYKENNEQPTLKRHQSDNVNVDVGISPQANNHSACSLPNDVALPVQNLSDKQIELAIVAKIQSDKVKDISKINRKFVSDALMEAYKKKGSATRNDKFIAFAKQQVANSSTKDDRKGFFKLIKGGGGVSS